MSVASMPGARWIETFVRYVGESTLLVAETARWLLRPGAWRAGRILRQIERIGWQSLPIVSFVALTIGMAVAYQTAYQMGKFGFGTYIYTASFSALMVFREIGPVLTGLIIAGRVGAAITAELGTMRMTQQIDALRSLATDPVKYLAVPRFVALLIALPLLTLYADVIGLLGSYIVGTTQLEIGPQLYVHMSQTLLATKDLWTGLVKAVVFAVIIATVSCQEGFRTQGGAEGVGQSTTRCVVIASTLIIAADAVFTGIFYFMGQ